MGDVHVSNVKRALGASGVALLLMGSAFGAAALPSSAWAAPRQPRPSIHIDKNGRVLQDVCPEYRVGQRRCFSQRILPMSYDEAVAKTKAWVKAHPNRGGGGGGGNSDPNCQSQGSNGTSTPPTGSMTPTDIRAAYHIPSTLKANGKIVALVELPSTNAAADLAAYRAQYSIPSLPACPTNSAGVPTPNGTACFARVGTDGTTKTASTTDCPGWAVETALDMDMVSAVCPDCSIVLVEGATTDGLDAMNTIAATTVHGDTISNSWGGPEQGNDDETPYGSAGTLEFAASGDQGYLDEDDGSGNAGVGANFPASSHYVVAVGGTNLDGANYTESVWNDDAVQKGAGAGGSGCSSEFAMPSYQSSSGINFASCTKRASVDVAAAAEFTPPSGTQGGGIASYSTDGGGWGAVVGTSAATPLVAAIFTLTGLGGTDNHALIYKNPSAFQDVTTGTNDNDSVCTDLMCTAGKGWDGPTGFGSPNATLLAALAGGGTVTPVDMAPPPDLLTPTGTTSSGSTTSSGTTGTTGSGGTTGTTGSGGTTSTGGADGGVSTIGQVGFGAACQQASDCASGICISGVCTTLCGGAAGGCGANQHCVSTGGFAVCAPGAGPSSGGCNTGRDPSATAATAALLLLAFGLLVVRRRQLS